jgi:hypothetical protein
MAQLPSEAAGSIVLPTPTPADAATIMETPSVELRPFVMTDSAVLHRMGNTPAVHRHLKYARFPQPYSEEHARHWLAETGIPAGSAAQLPIYLAISDPDTHECMGCAALEPKPDLEVFTAGEVFLPLPLGGTRATRRHTHLTSCRRDSVLAGRTILGEEGHHAGRAHPDGPRLRRVASAEPH